MKISLIHAMNRASLTVCNGYEIDSRFDNPNLDDIPKEHLYCGDDLITTVADQEVDIDLDGESTAKDVNGVELSFEFKVLKPLQESDIP